MDSFKKLTTAFPWKLPLLPLSTDYFSNKLPLYGPLNIKNYTQFLDDGKQIFNDCYAIKFPKLVALNEFNFLHSIAEGAFGKIILVERKNESKSLYAMKVISKSFVTSTNCVTNILNEKRILQSLDCPFCVRLEYFCQSNLHLYLFMPFISGGDVFTHLYKSGRFEENISKFFAAQVVLALEFMHYCDVVHRDLKPENLLIDHFGFIKLTDFGFAKVLTTRTYTFCGTIQYAAPEVILAKGYGKYVDWWSLGVLIYELNAGQVPFSSDDEMVMFKKIIQAEYTIPKQFNPVLKDLVGRLLQRDTSKRIGNLWRGVEEIKSHLWFKGINWLELLNRKVIPPFIPEHSNTSKINFPKMSKVSNISISSPTGEDHEFDDF